jgi:hypothetical protein
LMQTHCSILPSIADKMKQEAKKTPCKNSVCSQCSVTWQIDAIGLWMCDLGLPSHLLSPRQLTTITAQVFSDTTWYIYIYMLALDKFTSHPIFRKPNTTKQTLMT